MGETAPSTRPRAAALVLAVAAPLLLGLPLLGVWVDGRALASYLEFPPLTRYVEHAGFSWIVFLLMAVATVAVVAPFVVVPFRARGTRSESGPRGRFPAWAWCGVALTTASWFAAWTRLPALQAVQMFTFLPLWFGYILVVNGLVLRRTARCPLTDDLPRYAALFPLSAVFWWFFEYLNRFVQNWYYVGIEGLDTREYLLWNSLAFATVLPAVGATQALVMSFPKLHRGLENGRRIRLAQTRGPALVTLAAASLGLLSIGVWPDFTYPLVWLAPLGILASLQALSGRPNVFSPAARGDWRGLWTWALAALVCGLFWETWNYYSAARWIYAIPFVQRFQIFEMPLLGYGGYLPFGLECATVTLLAQQLRSRRRGESTRLS